MVFATIALVIVIVAYLFYLTIIQLLSGPRRDPSFSLPVPPRALTGNGAWPVIGHTILFHKYGGDMAFLFPPEWREWRCLPWSRRLGQTYSVFVWGQWNVIVKGPERVKKVILEGDLSEGWPYKTPATALLGNTCPAVLEEEEAQCLRSMVSEPLSYTSIAKQAPQFAELAEKCIDEIMAGHFNKGEKQNTKPKHAKDTDGQSSKVADEDILNTSESHTNDDGDEMHKIKLDALRSYTLDLMHGPVLNLDRDYRDLLASSSHLKNTPADEDEKTARFEEDEDKDKAPSQELILLWMDRLKEGLCDIQITYGPQWMQLWRLNPYGRALNARKHLVHMLSDHVEEREKLIPVRHEKGFLTRDPLNSAVPLWRLTEKYFLRNEHPVMGLRKSQIEDANRNRTRSENDLVPDMKPMEEGGSTNVGAKLRHRTQSEPDVLDLKSSRSLLTPSRRVIQTLLDQILRVADHEGQGITRMATTEVILLLWMMMDAGQAWTAMALHLLSKHEDACFEVQMEISRLEHKYKDRLFTSFVLGKMDKLDNLIYEAMRLSPAFMGGSKTVNQTVELDGVQIPKNTPVFLSSPHDDESFTIDYDPPKKPEEMGVFYPSIDLYGFLPLQGLEIPIMVLQTKVFLVVLLQKHAPVPSGRRKSFMRRVTEKFKSLRHMRSPSSNDIPLASPLASMFRSKSADDLASVEAGTRRAHFCSAPNSVPSAQLESQTSPAIGLDTPVTSTATASSKVRSHLEIRHEERLFTRVPFPEPRRSIQIRPLFDKELFPVAIPLKTPTKKPISNSRCRTE